MKSADNDELIITNEQQPEEQTSPASQPSATTEPSATTDTPDTPAAPEPKPAEPQQPQKSFSEILDEAVSEEDAPIQSSMTLIKILGGEFFSAQVLRRQIWLMMLIAAFTVLYISNRYSCQKSQIEVDKLNTELQNAKYRALATSSELTEMSRESNVLKVLKSIGDSAIHISDQPPYLIKIPEGGQKK